MLKRKLQREYKLRFGFKYNNPRKLKSPAGRAEGFKFHELRQEVGSRLCEKSENREKGCQVVSAECRGGLIDYSAACLSKTVEKNTSHFGPIFNTENS